MSNVNLKQPRPPINLRPLAGALILIGAVAAATAASINPAELDALRQEARRTGAVPVLVHLQSASLEQIRCCEAALRKSADVKIQQLLIELGRAALTNGQWGRASGSWACMSLNRASTFC